MASVFLNLSVSKAKQRSPSPSRNDNSDEVEVVEVVEVEVVEMFPRLLHRYCRPQALCRRTCSTLTITKAPKTSEMRFSLQSDNEALVFQKALHDDAARLLGR